MSAPLIQATTEIIQGENVLVRAQLLTESGVALTDDGASSTQAVLTASVHVYDITDPSSPPTLVNEGDPTQLTTYGSPPSSYFTSGASPWVTTGWKLGGSGFNAGFTIASSAVAVASPTLPTVQFKGGHTYRCEFLVTHNGAIVPGLTDGPICFDVIVHVRSSLSRSTA